ncbi:MAG TPA: RNA polymerase factor sigma-32 [Anaeromyxobacteraceae bacterium]|nr:RNA polymerase factor sigma-32 [Anaeromyxobacteraceae bacterium]
MEMPFLETYLSEISRYPLLTPEEERRLAREYHDHADTRAAHELVAANLRFVVKVAYGYRSYGLRLPDLVQEGNIGLMKAVQKFDPDLGIRLISYAVWWIRAYIQNYILRSWSLVKVGTTQAQRKLFFSLARTKRELERVGGRAEEGRPLETSRIARRLHVLPGEVEEMERRLEGRDLSLDAPVGDGASTHLDFVAGSQPGQDDALCAAQERHLMASEVGVALDQLDARERFIIEQRVMNDHPLTLKELGDHFGFSRERARQLEIRAKDKLRHALQALAARIEWPAGAPLEPDERAA